jgi:hypothetical protein
MRGGHHRYQGLGSTYSHRQFIFAEIMPGGVHAI